MNTDARIISRPCRRLFTYLPIVLLLTCLSTLQAQTTIASFTAGAGNGPASGMFCPGESFTTLGGNQWSLTSFNFYSDLAGTVPAAVGKAYVFTAAYAGTPAGLNVSLPNLIGVSTSVAGGKYIFPAGVILQPNTQYFLYTDTLFTVAGGMLGVAGAGEFEAVNTAAVFSPEPPQTLDFLAQANIFTPVPLSSALGAPISTPALVSLALLLAAVGSLLARSHNRASS